MIELLEGANQYHWLSLMCLLVILEIFGLAGFMLGFALAAFVVFLIMCFTDLIWQYQVLIFSFISLFATIAWYKYQSKADKADDQTTTLNKKENQLVGTIITLDEDIEQGKARVKVGDTTWAAYAEEALSKGDKVEVTKVNGIFLHIEKAK
jgi:membrane protein implicated in regulation of membrane protease activity